MQRGMMGLGQVCSNRVRRLMQPVLDAWPALPTRDFPNYVARSWGPMAVGELLNRDGRAWRACGFCHKDA